MTPVPDGGDAAIERVHLSLGTDLSRVGEVVDVVLSRCGGRDALSPRAAFRLCTVVAEALANAMQYGNGGDAQRRITIDLELRHDCVVIGVADEGDGFDHRAVPILLADESVEATRGRGLFMIHRLADHVVFNDRGNTIWMTLARH